MFHSMMNNLPVGKFFENKIKIKSNTVYIKTGDDWHISVDDDSFFKETPKSKFKISCNKFEISRKGIERFSLKEPYPQIDYRFKFSEERRIKRSRKVTLSDPNPYEFPCILKSIGLDTCHIVQSMDMVVNYKHIIRQVLSFPHKHIVPYRTYKDPTELVHRLHQYNIVDGFFGKYNSVFDMYEKSKDDCWKYISYFDTKNRNLEAILIDSGKKFSYFNLDEDSYCDVFGFKIPLEKNLTTPQYNLDDSDTRGRYNRALDICQEYLEVTGCKDTRLEYRSKDGI